METNQYLDLFIDESKEHLQVINDQMLLLEQHPAELQIVNVIFRSAHTLKGMSATMGYDDLAELTHQMESVLDAIRNKKLSITAEILDALFKSVDHLEKMVLSIEAGGDGKLDVGAITTMLQQIEKGESNDQQHTYEITVILREDCLLKAVRVFMILEVIEKVAQIIESKPSVNDLKEEKFEQKFVLTIVSKLSSDDICSRILNVSEVDKAAAHSIEWSEPTEDRTEKKIEQSSLKSSASISAPTSNKTIRVNIERIETLMNLFEELVIDRGRLEEISKGIENNELKETVERMSRISSDLQDIILTMRMVPVDQVFNRFPRMVRGLAKDLNKKVKLEIVGAETELDRTIIDEIGDPLVHLLRNSVDHGIESPDTRTQNGKATEGTVILRAFHSGNHVFIEIEDDGGGINRKRVLTKALQNGIVSSDEAEKLSENQVYHLLLASGFSTAEVVSDISGRGVGLDAVKNKIEMIGGSISIHSTEGKGTLFSIQLPLTLSIIATLLVEIGNEKYALPLTSIIETAVISAVELLTVHNQPAIDYRGKVIPVIFLNELFEVPVFKKQNSHLSIVIVNKGEKMAALVVDSIIGQQEVVLKSLGNYLQDVRAISGATILGNGKVALIIDCNAVIK
jgi:two-component system chemotaxis sensor kinase CheA